MTKRKYSEVEMIGALKQNLRRTYSVCCRPTSIWE